jgi:meiotic recombination protein SPO11
MFDLIECNKHATKRDIYYTNTELYQSQRMVDEIVDDLSCLFNVPRRDTHIIASPKGLVYGELRYKENGKWMDCSKFTFGKPISPFPSNSFQTNCKFILIVEKCKT